MPITRKINYLLGTISARIKLGLAAKAQPLEYNPVSRGHKPIDSTDAEVQQLWKEFDSQDNFSNESYAKNANYSDHSGTYAEGSFDLDEDQPTEEHNQRSAINRAFKTNKKVDTSHGPEPPLTQPHGVKAANNPYKNTGGTGVKPIKPENPVPAPKPPINPEKSLPESPMQDVRKLIEGTSAQQSFSSSDKRLTGNPL